MKKPMMRDYQSPIEYIRAWKCFSKGEVVPEPTNDSLECDTSQGEDIYQVYLSKILLPFLQVAYEKLGDPCGHGREKYRYIPFESEMAEHVRDYVHRLTDFLRLNVPQQAVQACLLELLPIEVKERGTTFSFVEEDGSMFQIRLQEGLKRYSMSEMTTGVPKELFFDLSGGRDYLSIGSPLLELKVKASHVPDMSGFVLDDVVMDNDLQVPDNVTTSWCDYSVGVTSMDDFLGILDFLWTPVLSSPLVDCRGHQHLTTENMPVDNLLALGFSISILDALYESSFWPRCLSSEFGEQYAE